MSIPAGRSLFKALLMSFLFAVWAIPVLALGSSHAPDGIWTGTATVDGHAIPFRLELSGIGDTVNGALLNGRRQSTSSEGSYKDGHLVLRFDYFANTLDATVSNGTLIGSFGGHARSVPLSARLYGAAPAAAPNPPNIAGDWEVAVSDGTKGEQSWKLRVRQSGAAVHAVIERIDGDTGDLYGVWRDGVFAVSHFTAAGPGFAILRPQPDGGLQVETAAHGGGVRSYPARRVSPVHPVALATLDDPMHHTSLKNPNQPLAFRFPDLSGKVVSSTDPEFSGKPLIVSIGGSWCPNCQDEAPFLESLYRAYHTRGLNIVELSFEETAQLQNPMRLKAVIRRYGITYPVLLAGTPAQLAERFPNVVHLDCWPTTFFVGRDGRVKAIHTGYAGPATGSDNHKLENEVTALLERLLTDKPARLHAVQVARNDRQP
jgi:thiol-disulfide isomerase/thioredoxin